MHFDPAFTVGNLLTILALVICGGGWLCRMSHELATLRRDYEGLSRDFKEHLEWASKIASLTEERVRSMERHQDREGAKGREY